MVAVLDVIGLIVRDLGALGGPDVIKRTRATEDGFELGFVFRYQAVNILLLDAIIFDRFVL